ncbi:PQQ-binding-like beta-propeller repeat protein [Polyangium aurulentum]|uniref:PQQ-binding-like beta-propeller repeat protein n=1 Tax=Polyangium aurulentum TaxID=2567896 RepID=UPI001980DAE4|nr:PQQ-binding-like beta-propeller repeat protein [Polyangium aurulentum]UQA63308.1 PQQ-binding-like beta-propeller repeat protein [Polyangium aurulentum]
MSSKTKKRAITANVAGLAGFFLAIAAGASGCGGSGVEPPGNTGGAGGAGGAGGVGGAGGAGGAGGVGGSGGAGGAPCVPVDDGNPCTLDLCKDDVAVHEPAEAGTACMAGSSLCDGQGSCVECLAPEHCPGADDACKTRTCTQGTCGASFTPAGVEVPGQTPADCKKVVCDGSGSTIEEADDLDLPVDNNACTDDLCTAGAPSNPIKAQGTPCGDSMGSTLVCDASGACVGCNTAAECPGTDDECKARTCERGVCGFSMTAAGTPVAAQTAGDCVKSICDGSGNITNAPDDADVPSDDGNVCTDEACNAGVPSHSPSADGTSCTDGNECTTGDGCQAGACTSGAPVVCAALDACHIAGTCDPQTGECSNPPVVCNPGTACVNGACLATEAVTYQINPFHDGSQIGNPLPLPLTKKWSVNLGGQISYPLIAGGRVFVTVGKQPNYGTKLHALDEHTGAPLWGPLTISGTYFFSGAAYDAGKVYVVNFDGVLRAFDAATGTFLWGKQMPGQYAFSSPPTAVDGKVYVGGAGSGGTLYAVDGANGDVLWSMPVAGGDSSAPVVAPGGVYVSYLCNNVYDFDPASGALLWQYPGNCSGGAGRTAALFEGKLYAREPGLAASLILDAQTGQSTGTFQAGPIPAFHGSRGFFVYQGKLDARDVTTLQSQWSFAPAAGLVSAPIVVGNQVFVGASNGDLYALDEQTGAVLWSGNVGGPIYAPDEHKVASPLTGLAAADGVLIVPAGDVLVGY